MIAVIRCGLPRCPLGAVTRMGRRWALWRVPALDEMISFWSHLESDSVHLGPLVGTTLARVPDEGPGA